MNSQQVAFPSKISKFRYYYNNLIQKKLNEHGIYDLHSSYGNILYALYGNEKMTMKELAASINRDKSTLTVLIRKLEKQGYVEKVPNPADSRSKFIVLTEKSLKIKPIVKRISAEVNQIIWGDLTETEISSLLVGLEKVTENVVNKL